MRAWRRFYRRNRTLVTAVAIGVAALALVGRVPLMPDADAMFTPLSGFSAFVASPAAGGALLFVQRRRRAIRWYALACLLGASAPMLVGWFANVLPDAPMPSAVGDVAAALSSFVQPALFAGGSWLGYRMSLARRPYRRR